MYYSRVREKIKISETKDSKISNHGGSFLKESLTDILELHSRTASFNLSISWHTQTNF